MTETRDFPTAVLVSLSTGISLCTFSDFHEAAEYLMGHPIWTHQLPKLADAIKRAIVEQYPNVPTKIEGVVTKDNYLQKIAEIESEIGTTLKIRKGSGLTAMLPTDGIPDRLKDKTTIMIV
jgi:hypothetical protein